MLKLKNNIYSEYIAIVEDVRYLKKEIGLRKKKLCIIKSDFTNLHLIRSFCNKYPHIEVWLVASEICRKNILLANSNGVKKVLKEPIDAKVIEKFFEKRDKTTVTKPIVGIPKYNSLKGLKVMVVDDNQMNVDLLVETLSILGINLTTSIKPLEAVKVVKEEHFDLFLLDIMMPELSGFELSNIIKRTDINKDSLVVFISALSDSEHKITSYNLGSCAYIEKPFDVAVVRSQIYNLLKTKQLKEALKEKKENFLAMVTHDLKTPVYAEIYALELLNKNSDKLDGVQKEIIADVLNAARYMKTLVENLMLKYNIENEKLNLNRKICSLERLTISCIEDTKYLFDEKSMKYILRSKARNCSAMMDGVEIKRVIHNLITNSIEHGIKDSEIIIEIDEIPDYVSFAITNYGIGYAISSIDDILQKRINAQEKEKKINSGLGLYIAKRIIEAHNGKIALESEVNQFVKMKFFIPKR